MTFGRQKLGEAVLYFMGNNTSSGIWGEGGVSKAMMKRKEERGSTLFYASTNPEDVAEVKARKIKLNKLSEKVQAGDHGTALEERGEDEAECVGEDVLLDGHHGARADLHHRAQQGEH